MKKGGIWNAFARWRWPEPECTCTYEYLSKYAMTGDVLLWRASGSIWTPFWTDCPFSHVSLVYRDPETNELYQWQSTTHSENRDFLSHEFNRNGTQLTPLRESLMHYAEKWGDRIAWRQLQYRLPDGTFTRDFPPEVLGHINKAFQEIMEMTRGYDFQHNFIDMMGGKDFNMEYMGCCIGRPPNFQRKIFCAPLAAGTLLNAHIIRAGFPIGHYSPASFDYKTHQLFLTPDFGYSETILLVFGDDEWSATFYI